MEIFRTLPSRQRGITLVLLTTIFAVVLLGIFVAVISVKPAQLQAAEKTAAALAMARDGLIAYAAMHQILPGRLPCPDSDGDGIANTPCGAVGTNALGRLPWKTLGLPDLRDAGGECLWYAVSGNFREDAASPINSDSTGNFEVKDDPSGFVTGATAGTRAIAVVFAPGPVLPGNNRATGTTVCGTSNNAADFLDTKNGTNNATPVAAGTATFVAGILSDTFNDRLAYITPAQFFPSIERRVAGEIKKLLLSYYASNGYYPYANDLADPSLNCTLPSRRGRVPLNISSCPGAANWPSPLPAWFTSEQWNLLTYYAVAPACTQATPAAPPTVPPTCAGAGFLTLQNGTTPNSNKQVLLIEPGPALTPSQTPPCGPILNCLEGVNADNADDLYTTQPASSTFNDVVLVVGS